MKNYIGDANHYDLADLMDMDVKSNYIGWAETVWRRAISENLVFIAYVHNVPVGFLVLDSQSNPAIIRRCGAVNEDGKGVMDALFEIAIGKALDCGCQGVEHVVPETHIDPGKPDDVSLFLKQQGFQAVTPLLANYYRIDGDTVDGVKFARYLNDEPARYQRGSNRAHPQRSGHG